MTSKSQYHHPDLRATLLDMTARVIAEEGVDKLTMRDLSRRIGVSRSAPYRHFPDKTALLCAVAERGFYQLRTILSLTISSFQEDPLLRFRAMCLKYVEFAVHNSAQYLLMFGCPMLAGQCPPPLRQAVRTAFEGAEAVLEECRLKGRAQITDPARMADVAWATVHGLSMLIIDGQMGGGIQDKARSSVPGIQPTGIPEEQEGVVEAAIRNLIAGMRAG